MAADAIVSVSMGVMKPILAKLTTLMGDEYKKIKGLPKEVEFLQDEFGEMDALLEMMDSVDKLNPQETKWRRDIIEMSYNIEDRIDDFLLSIGEADNKMGFLKKAVDYVKTFKKRCDLANDFQEMKTRVKEASERRKRYMVDLRISSTTPVVVDPRVLTLYEESASLVGIDAEKDQLVKWASMDEGKQLKFMAIVGLGGSGKTTLANEVFRQVEGQFNYKAHVCVSQKPDITKLLKRLLFNLGLRQYYHDYLVEQDLVAALRTHLQDKRYFIVVDDLWEMDAWDAIRCAFPQNNDGSRVMITTRNENVTKRWYGNDGFIHNMKPLSEPDSRKLFFTRAFTSQDGCPSEFEEVSCAILKRCGGLPLAIITIAGILASQQTQVKETWECIQTELLAHELETNIGDYDKMMHILDLSYKHLPRDLKVCFLYLGTYPEDHSINKVELVRRWVAEGFVSAEPNAWDVAESYFNELVNRSIIQPSFRHQNVILKCRVHDMMLDLILRRCKEDNFLTLVNEAHEVAAGQQDKVIRRLTMDLKGVYDDARLAMTTNNESGNLSHLRSLTILFREGSKWKPPLPEFKFVRVVLLSFAMLSVIEMDLFGIINQLRHLRYFKVDGAQVLRKTLVTTQIKGLRLLETLDLSRLHVERVWRDCHKFVLDFVDLSRLSHLSVDATSGIALPRGIGEMKQLRTLRGLDLDHSSLESIRGLGELKALSELYLVFAGLCTHGSEWKPEWMPSLSTSLGKTDKLRSLDVQTSSASVAHCIDGQRSLFPPRSEGSLERLHLLFWTFSIVPRWIGQLHSIKELRLGVKQIMQEDIGVLGSLPSLVDLKLRIVHALTTRMVIGGGLFKAVKVFTFNSDGISYLTFEANAMPNLGELTLEFSAADWNRKH